ncbi:hypothetical protein ACVIRO_004733 [Rhizobium ruizarguesonis]|jgi:hypothetical protein
MAGYDRLRSWALAETVFNLGWLYPLYDNMLRYAHICAQLNTDCEYIR